MTSYLFVLVLSGTLLQVTDAVDCMRHYNAFGKVEGPKVCDFGQSCCGSCKVRLCCPFPSLLELVSSDIINLSEDVQDACPNNFPKMLDPNLPMFLIVVVVVIGVIFISLIIFCCVCPCCCLYQMCRKPRPAVRTNTHTTVVVNNPGPPQAPPYNPPGPPQAPPYNPPPAQQYPGYQPVPMPPWSGAPVGYGGHPVPSAPMLEQPYGLGPPPPYQENAVTGGPPSYC